MEGIHADAHAALQHLVETADVDSGAIIVLGQSLGGAVAIQMVARTPYRRRIKGLVVEGAFASYAKIAQEKLAELWLTWPLQLLPYATIPGAYDAVNAVSAVSPIPLVIIHGDADPIVPPTHGYRLLKAARAPKELWIVPGGGHIEAFRNRSCRQRLVDFLRRVSETDQRQDEAQERAKSFANSPVTQPARGG